MMKKRRVAGLVMLIVGAFFLFSSYSGITGFVIAKSVSRGTISVVGIALFIGGLILSLVVGSERRSRPGELEEKLGKINNVRIMRELISDAHRAEKFAERGLDVNGLWDTKKSYEENKNAFLNEFYDDVDNEITEGYWKGKLRKTVSLEQFKNKIDQYMKTEDFKIYKERALKAINHWNDKILSGDYVPLLISSEGDSTTYKGMKTRMIIYGPGEFAGKSRSFYEKKIKTGEVAAAHEIVSPEVIKNPEKLKEFRDVSHIHWEVENVSKEGFKLKGN